jgi:presenilin-like A22 family membrane protease
MKERKFPVSLAYAGMILLMAATNVFALLLINPMQNAGLFAFEDPESIVNVVYFLFLMLVVTAVMLILIRKKIRVIISVILAISLAMVIYYVAFALLSPFIPNIAAHITGAVIGIGGILLLKFYPEWFVIDAVGLITSAGCAAIFGISLSPLPVVVLLILLVVYDYVAVHKTKHMLTLADGVMQQKMPIMFLVPKKLKYSYAREGFAIQDKKEERGAYMLGLGDVIFPGVLVVSAQVFCDGLNVFGLALPSLGALAGAVFGMILLAIPMRSGKPQPGLPLINGCAIVGFIICCAVSGSWDWIAAGLW